MKRGEVYDVHLPPPENQPGLPDSQQPGHEQRGDRPAIIVTNDGDIPNLSVLLVVPITTNLKALAVWLDRAVAHPAKRPHGGISSSCSTIATA